MPIVKSTLAWLGVHVDLCAWMPLRSMAFDNSPGNTKFDSCAMFVVGGTIQAPQLLWGLREASHGGGSDGLEYMFEGARKNMTIPEGAHEDDDDAESFDGNAGAEEQLGECDLLMLPLNSGAFLTGYMPGCSTKETDAKKREMNRAAMAAQLAWSLPDDRDEYYPPWPRVRQKKLERRIYDGSDQLLRGGAHVPLAFCTVVPGQRSPHGEAKRKASRRVKWEERRGSGSSGKSAAVAAASPPMYDGSPMYVQVAASLSPSSANKSSPPRPFLPQHPLPLRTRLRHC